MLVADPQHVFGQDRDERAQEVGPQKRRPQQDAHADASDVGTGGMDPDAVRDAAKRQLRDDGRGDREPRALRALQDAEREMGGQENRRDQQRRQVAVVEPEPAHGANSLTLCTRSTSGLTSVSCWPDGHVITARSTCVAPPSPKCRRRWFCALKPLAATRSCRCTFPDQCSSTRAPIAPRLLLVPSSSKSIQCRAGSTLLRYKSSGPRWLATTTSSAPRLSKSASATARPSKASFAPT